MTLHCHLQLSQCCRGHQKLHFEERAKPGSVSMRRVQHHSVKLRGHRFPDEFPRTTVPEELAWDQNNGRFPGVNVFPNCCYCGDRLATACRMFKDASPVGLFPVKQCFFLMPH